MDAPFYHDLAEGPDNGRALWLRTPDGVRIRIGIWSGGRRGTVVLLPGRTEYIEKYGRAAADLRAEGWSVLAIDWRGQGLADRFLSDPLLGHVAKFTDYQSDLDAALDWLRDHGAAQGLTGPLVLFAHSMGGLIGLRALYRGLPFAAAVFSAPMWGIRVPVWRRPMAALLCRVPLRLPQDHHYAPTTSSDSYILKAGFAGNHLTSDLETWDYLSRHLKAVPEFRLGGPSLGWLRSALSECLVIRNRPAPQVPALVALGSHEQIVKPAPILQRMRDWKAGRLQIYEGARHEVPMERAEHRARFFREAVDLFNRATECSPAE